MKYYFDETFPPTIAPAIDILEKQTGIEVLNIIDEFGRGAKDEEWIPQIGKYESIIITQDYNINRMRQLRELYIKHKLGIFIFQAPSKSGYRYWKWVKVIINTWEELKNTTQKSNKPFGFLYKPRSKKPIDLHKL